MSSAAPPYVDTTKASVARVYDAFLNGTDNYEIDRSHLIGADIFQPSQVLDNEVVRKELDFSQHIALYQCGTLHHYSGECSPADIMREYIDALPSGSYVALSHFFDPETTDDSVLARKMEDIFLHSPMGSGMFRTRAEIESMFDGLELVDPA